MRSDHQDEPGEALFHEEDDARAVAEELRAAGHAAQVERARFAGEDDDEDQPWRVRTTAGRALLAAYAGPREGWLEPAPAAGAVPARPLPLPTAPRRAHHPRDSGPVAPPT